MSSAGSNTIVLRASPKPHTLRRSPQVWAVKRAAADVLEQAADLLDAPDRTREPLRDGGRSDARGSR